MKDDKLGAYRGETVTNPEKKRDYNRKMFGIVARRYSLITRLMSFWQDSTWKRELLKALPVKMDGMALDIACGTGDITFGLARKYPCMPVIGADLTREMIDIAILQNTLSNVTFSLQDMAQTGIKDGAVAIVTGGYALRNAPDIDKALIEIRRVLRPGGIAAFLDFSKSPQPVIKGFHYWLLRAWGSFWGLIFHGNPAVYAYIAESLKAFPDRNKLAKKANDLGFLSKHSCTFMGGMIALNVWEKPPSLQGHN